MFVWYENVFGLPIEMQQHSQSQKLFNLLYKNRLFCIVCLMYRSREFNTEKITHIKGTISDPKFQTSLFSEPQIVLHIQEETHYNKLHVEQFPRKQHILGKTDNFLLLEINYRRR